MRYFVVFYVGEGHNGKTNYGSLAGDAETYPNIREVVKQIKEGGNLKSAAITNIIELSKADFDEFKR